MLMRASTLVVLSGLVGALVFGATGAHAAPRVAGAPKKAPVAAPPRGRAPTTPGSPRRGEAPGPAPSASESGMEDSPYPDEPSAGSSAPAAPAAPADSNAAPG